MQVMQERIREVSEEQLLAFLHLADPVQMPAEWILHKWWRSFICAEGGGFDKGCAEV